MRLNAIVEAVALHGRARIDDEPAETRFTHQAAAQSQLLAPAAPQIAQPPTSSDPAAGLPPPDPRILVQEALPPAPPPAPTASARQLATVDSRWPIR